MRDHFVPGDAPDQASDQASKRPTPYRSAGSPAARTAVLLLHGFTGSTVSMRPWAEWLATQGYPVAVPLLPGHGTRWQELNRCPWQDWYACADAELSALLTDHPRVVVGGLSMGATLALRLAQQRDLDVAGLMLVNPFIQIDDRRLFALPVLKRLLASLPGITDDIKLPGQTEGGYPRLPLRGLAEARRLLDLTRGDLNRVRCPVLVMRSTIDHTIGTNSGRTVLAGLGSDDVTDLQLADSFHVATLDNDADQIHQASDAFLKRLSQHSQTTNPAYPAEPEDRTDAADRAGRSARDA